MMNSRRLYLVYLLMPLIPSTRCFGLKRALLSWCGASLGKNVRVVSSARFYISGNLEIGDDTWIGHDLLIVGGGADVKIGSKVDIGPRVSLITGTHDLLTTEGRAAGTGQSLPITIENGVWIGASATVLPGVVVGFCSVIAAGALVNRDVEARVIVGGVPAILIKST